MCGIKTRDENGINLMFSGIQHPFQEIFFCHFSDCFFYTHVIFLKLFLSFLFTCDLKRERERGEKKKPLLLCVFFQSVDDLREVLEALI